MGLFYKVTFATLSESEYHYYNDKDSIIIDIAYDKNNYFYDGAISANHVILKELINSKFWFQIHTLDNKNTITIERLYTRDS